MPVANGGPGPAALENGGDAVSTNELLAKSGADPACAGC
jgi:hypothetical protein